MLHHSSSSLFHQAYEMIADCHLCFVATLGRQGHINSRVVETLERSPDLTVRFMTDRKTRKIADIVERKRVSLSFLCLPDRGYVSLGGAIEVTDDLDMKTLLWKDSLLRWFPDGPQDPNVVCVTCRPDWVEIWSLSRGISPPPRGLNSARLSRRGTGWEISETHPNRVGAS